MNAARRFVTLVILVGTLLFTGCGNRFGKKEKAESFDITPPFYKAVDEETGGVVYMLGAMHIGKAGAVYPEEVYSALDECEVLVVEVDVQRLSEDRAEVNRAMEVLMCEDGKTARDYMGDDYGSILMYFKAEGIYNSNFERYLPTTWTTQWSNYMAKECGYSSEEGTERVILTYAKKRGKAVEEIETAREQYQIDADTSVALQMYSLKNTVNSTFEETKSGLDVLYNAWKSFDEDTLRSLAGDGSGGGLPEELKEDYKSYYNAMYAGRQEKMTRVIIDKLRAGEKAFVAVGALHYIAPPSILDHLEESGYNVVKAYNQGL